MNDKTTFFENKIKPLLLYIGSIGAIITSIAYIILMFVMIIGFKVQANWYDGLIFAIINAIIGFIILQFLKVQGLDFASNKHQETVAKYNQLTARKKAKTKHGFSLKIFWITSVIRDILSKVLTTVITTVGLIYIVIQGSQDFNLLLLAVVNLLLFASFGLLGMVRSYDFFNDKYIPWIEEIINEEENKKALELAKTEPLKQADDSLHSNRGTNILESSNSDSDISYNNKPVVVGYSWNDMSILGWPDNTSDSASDRTYIPNQENTQQN